MNFLDNWQGLVLLAAFPLIGAAIGWLTNRLAIQMLFRPRRAVRLLGMRFQGLIPRRQSELATRVAEIVETELFNQHLIRDEIRKMDLKPYLEQLADSIVHQRIGPKLRQVPLLGNLVNDRFLNGLKALAFDSLSRETEPLLERVSMEVEKHIAVRRIVEERIHAFDLDQLEAIVRRLAREEFQRIELLGAVIGFAIGLVQVALLVLAQAL